MLVATAKTTPAAAMQNANIETVANTNSFWHALRATFTNVWFVVPIAFVGAILCAVLVGFADALYLARAPGNTLAQILYRRMVWYAQTRGVAVTDGVTPHEIYEHLQTHFETRQDSRTLLRLWQASAAVLKSPLTSSTVVARSTSKTQSVSEALRSGTRTA